jgi:hypothetical protein
MTSQPYQLDNHYYVEISYPELYANTSLLMSDHTLAASNLTSRLVDYFRTNRSAWAKVRLSVILISQVIFSFQRFEMIDAAKRLLSRSTM